MADKDEQQDDLTDFEGEEFSAPDDEELAVLLPAVVGIGVCAVSLRSLAELFDTMEAETGAAFLIAVRQKEGLEVSSVVEALASVSPMPVRLAQHGEPLLPNRIFVAAPDDLITVEAGHVRARRAAEPVGHRGTVDSLLISLAQHSHERTVAVILAGLGADGAAGLVATKKFGGLSIAESVEDRPSDGEPGSAGPQTVADLHLPADRIAGEISRYIRNLQLPSDAGQAEQERQEIEAQVTQVAAIMRNVTGHDFHGYKRGTFIRRIRRRMQVRQIDSIEAYLKRLRADREEVQHLFQDLLIGVTQFFRDPAEFEALQAEIPRLFENRGADNQVRVWVLGCATGEEAYSLAILLREHMETLANPPEVQIFATDLDARSLSLARAGRYSAASLADHVRPDRLERWFVREGDTFCVSKEVREMCIFSPHNIVKDAPFSRIDILSCRNLLIYLSTELQNRVIPIFHFALRPGGILFLGSSENVTRHPKLFAPVNRKCRIFRRLDTAARIIPDFPLAARPKPDPGGAGAPLLAHGSTRLPVAANPQAEAVASRYAPAYVVVDAHGEVLHFSGRTGRYLEPSAGSATLNLASLVHRDIRLEVRTALQRSVAEGRRIELSRLLLNLEDRVQAINLIVEPLSSGDVTALVVVFQDLGQVVEGTGTQADRVSADEHVQRLEAELRITRDRLQATIEELESTVEELKSSNEEYQSINEELQSANEEMETSKEELQSVNEELQTVNGELAHRVQELRHANSDLKNLLESTQIATVFLDNELRVRNFTPTATEVFHLLETDVGRPVGHVVSRVAYPELQEDVRRVLKSLVPMEREVEDQAAGRRYVARVLPYRSLENFINGTVVTFTDLTAISAAESALRKSKQRLQRVLETEAVGVEFFNYEGLLLNANDVFLRMTGYTRSQIERGELDWRRMTPPEYYEESEAQMAGLFATGRIGPYEKEHIRADGSRCWMLFAGRDLGDGTIVEFCIDISDRKRVEAALRESEQRQQILIEGVPQLVWRAAGQGDWTWASPQWTEYTGQSAAESLHDGWLNAAHPDDRNVALAAWEDAEERGAIDVEYRILHAADGSYRWFRTRAAPFRNEQGAIVEWLGTSTDMHDMRELHKRHEVLVAELQHRVRNMLTVIRSVFGQTVESGGEIEDIADHFRGRLDALARTQVIVTRTPLGLADLEMLIRDELLSVGATDEDRVRISGPEVGLKSKTAEALGLAIHELTTNAIKYGALKTTGAKLNIFWDVNMDQGDATRLTLTWNEQGVPTVPTKPTRDGFGRELIEEALPYRLGAETKLEFLGGGIRCTISVPVHATPGEGGEPEFMA